MIKAFLFDLDGTLADTNSLHRLTWVDTLKPHGYDVTWDFYRDKINGRLTPRSSPIFFPTFRARRSKRWPRPKKRTSASEPGS